MIEVMKIVFVYRVYAGSENSTWVMFVSLLYFLYQSVEGRSL